MENCVFKKIYLEDNTPVRLHIILVDSSLRLIVLQNKDAWKSFVISEKLNHFAIQHKLSLENYIEKLFEYIKNCGSDVAFVVTKEEFIINRFLDVNLKVKYFACKLEKVNYVEYVEQIMDSFYSENIKSWEKLNSTIKEKNEIETYKISCELKLKELIEKKKCDEEELFGHFVLILNEKKHRIQHLTELLEAFKAGRPTTNLSVPVKSRKKKTMIDELPPKAKKMETVSESETSESFSASSDSDDNKAEETQPSHFNKDEPSTSTQGLNFLDDDSVQVPLLPKRIKHDTNYDNTVMAIPSTSKSSQPSEDDDKLQRTDKKDSPTIDFNTQQLLDML